MTVAAMPAPRSTYERSAETCKRRRKTCKYVFDTRGTRHRAVCVHLFLFFFHFSFMHVLRVHSRHLLVALVRRLGRFRASHGGDEALDIID